jgi:hypothetical protein
MARAAFCRSISALALAFLTPALAGAAMSEEEMFFKGVSEVNDGDLVFLTEAPSGPIHHHQNQITLTRTSLADGWARLEQCHHHLDPVPDMQIVYNRDRIRDIAILRSENIGRSWVHENTVQLDQVARNALICITAETRALDSEGDHTFALSNGPYMRRFLDGYYPMRVSMRVLWDMPELRFVDISPSPQSGLSFSETANEVGYEALFEGQLRTRIRFSIAPR